MGARGCHAQEGALAGWARRGVRGRRPDGLQRADGGYGGRIRCHESLRLPWRRASEHALPGELLGRAQRAQPLRRVNVISWRESDQYDVFFHSLLLWDTPHRSPSLRSSASVECKTKSNW